MSTQNLGNLKKKNQDNKIPLDVTNSVMMNAKESQLEKNPKDFRRKVTRLLNGVTHESAGETGQRLRAPGAVRKDQLPLLITHIRRRTVVCNSSAKRFDILF